MNTVRKYDSVIPLYDEGIQIYCKVLCIVKIMTLTMYLKVPANLVPEASVIREGLALFITTGLKGFVDGLMNCSL